MIASGLTDLSRAAMSAFMQSIGQGPAFRQEFGRSNSRALGAAVLLGSALALSGCISVNAPDKPIVIELNINIKQEVIYRLADDAKKTIDTNSGIF
jgi:hypothetical protein